MCWAFHIWLNVLKIFWSFFVECFILCMQGVSFIRFMKQKYGISCVFVNIYPSQSSRVSVNPLIFMWYVAIMQYFENNTFKIYIWLPENIFEYRQCIFGILLLHAYLRFEKGVRAWSFTQGGHSRIALKLAHLFLRRKW